MRGRKHVVATEHEPYVSNYPPLRDWLTKIEARCISQTPVGEGSFKCYLEMWQAQGTLAFMILVRPFKHGWEIYTPCASNDVAKTLEDAEARIRATT